MKFIHLADLHIGKTVSAFSMLEDQEHVLAQALDYVRLHKPDAVVIAGDVYDRLTPPPDAVRALDRFVTALAAEGPAVMIISGNHDSPERLGFAGGILRDMNVHIYGVFDGKMRIVSLCDEYGEARFYLLPFVRPADIRRFYGVRQGWAGEAGSARADLPAPFAAKTHAASVTPGVTAPAACDAATTSAGAAPTVIDSYQDAVTAVVADAGVDVSVRNVLISHQFYSSAGSAPERSESEREMIGGIDMIGVEASGVAALFDYVALGHLHSPQRAGAEHIRYAGSPVKYSLSECHHKKCALLVELRNKGELSVTQLPLKPLRDMRRIRGRLDDLIIGSSSEDYLHVILTDEDEIYDAIGKLRAVYPNVLRLDYDNARTSAGFDFNDAGEAENKPPLVLFEDFFISQNGTELDDEQRKAVTELLSPEGGDAV